MTVRARRTLALCGIGFNFLCSWKHRLLEPTYLYEGYVIIIMIIINLIYIAQFDTNGILTALYIVIAHIQMQYVHV